ncbi:MAG: hypothetical protein RIK85_00005, partial [Marinobacter sp.]
IVVGILVPYLDMAHHPFRQGDSFEQNFGRAAFEKKGEKKWIYRLHRAISTLEHLFNYDYHYICGG